MSERVKDKTLETEDGRENLTGFFALLLKVDKRINPHIYQNENNRGPNNAN